MVELRKALDDAAAQIGASKLLLSVCPSVSRQMYELMSSMLLLVEVLGTSWTFPRWML